MIKIGCCGFSIAKDRYFKNFCLVEIQQSFYQLPDEKTALKWRREAPLDFEYTLKAWQLITHPSESPTYKKLKIKIEREDNYGFFRSTEEVFSAWQDTAKIAHILGAKIIIFQCPASFKPEKKNIENLRKFFKNIKRDDFIFCWEVRGNWNLDLIKSLCKELDLVHCSDPFKQRPVWGRINYFRLHGRPDYNLRYKYTSKDLNEILRFCDKEENYVLFNNIFSYQDALRFKRLYLNKKLI